MTVKITARQVAETMLDILVRDIGLKPRQEVPDQLLKQTYRARSHDAGDLKVGFEYAHQQGWLEYDRARDAFRLTRALVRDLLAGQGEALRQGERVGARFPVAGILTLAAERNSRNISRLEFGSGGAT
jgi:hypothetical protein